MDARHKRSRTQSIRDARYHRGRAEETIARLKELEAEMSELVARIRWQMFLGYDQASVEFVRKLDVHH